MDKVDLPPWVVFIDFPTAVDTIGVGYPQKAPVSLDEASLRRRTIRAIGGNRTKAVKRYQPSLSRDFENGSHSVGPTLDRRSKERALGRLQQPRYQVASVCAPWLSTKVVQRCHLAQWSDSEYGTPLV